MEESFQTKKEIDDTSIKDIRNLFRLKKENEVIKNRVIRDIRRLSEDEKEENYYKPLRVGNFWSNNYIEQESSGNRNKTLSSEEYFNKIRSYLKDIINDLKKSDRWRIQLTIVIHFFFFKANNEECVKHLKSDNVEFMIFDNADEIIR